MNTVAVLMSVYNGEKYLKEQIDSILAQEDVEVKLYIRDDGSKDNTIEIIEQYAVDHDIELIEGDNLGVGNSFMHLVYRAGDSYEYYAFADQDDIWLPKKLIRAITVLGERADHPCCYCSNQTLVDADGTFICQRYSDHKELGYMNVLCNNEVTGCTMVWNKALQRIISDERHHPSADLLKKRIHDVWVGMVASVVGEVLYDSNSYILYRQHGNNVVGAQRENIFKLWKVKLMDPTLRRGRSGLCREIIQLFGKEMIPEGIYERLYRYASYAESLKGKLSVMLDRDIRKYSREDVFTYSLKVLMDLF